MSATDGRPVVELRAHGFDVSMSWKADLSMVCHLGLQGFALHGAHDECSLPLLSASVVLPPPSSTRSAESVPAAADGTADGSADGTDPGELGSDGSVAVPPSESDYSTAAPEAATTGDGDDHDVSPKPMRYNMIFMILYRIS